MRRRRPRSRFAFGAVGSDNLAGMGFGDAGGEVDFGLRVVGLAVDGLGGGGRWFL